MDHLPRLPHDGAALAADEPGRSSHRPPGLASVHIRALITWIAIFPLAAVGMTVLTALVSAWAPALKALVLTAVVVPLSVYVIVPRLLLLRSWFPTRRAARSSGRLGPAVTRKEV